MLVSDWSSVPPELLIPRTRLIAALDDAISAPFRRLTVIVAPAGAGKTVLLRQWAAAHPAGVRAISTIETAQGLDTVSLLVHHLHGDCRFTDLVSALVAVLVAPVDRAHFQQIRSELFAFQDGSSERCIIIIDDLDHLPPVTRRLLVDGLLAHPQSPDTFAIIAAGRAPTHHSLGHLAVAGRQGNVFARDMAFTAPELAQFLTTWGMSEVTTPLVDAVMDATFGWPAGVALGSHLLSVDEPGQWLPFDDYVATRILGALHDATDEVLQVAAILPWLDADLWETLAAVVNDRVDRFDVIRSIIPLRPESGRSDGRRVFLIPPLLRASFSRRAGGRCESACDGSTTIDRVATLIDAALHWLVSRGLYGDAIAVAGATGRWSIVMPPLIRQCRELAIRDDHTRLIALIAPLPESQLFAYDDLAFWFILSLLSVGSIAEGSQLYPRLETAWSDRRSVLQQGRLHVLSALLAIWHGDRVDARTRALSALSILPDDAFHERMRAAATAEVLSTHLGQREVASRMFEVARAAREHLPWDQHWWTTFVLPNQADRLALEGDLSTASSLFRHGIDSYSRVFPDQMTLLYMRLGLIELERGNLEVALGYMDRISPAARQGYWSQEVPLARAKILHALGHDHDASDLLYAAIRDANAERNEIDARRSRAVLAQLWLDRGERDLADTWAAEESLSMDIWPRSFGQTVPGTVLAHLHILHRQWAKAMALLDTLIGEGERRGQSAPLVRVLALKALASALAGELTASRGAIRRAIAIGGTHGFHRSYFVGELDTRLLLGTPEQTMVVALAFPSPSTQIAGVKLSDRELDVLRLAMQGLTNAEVAKRLYISPMTVKNHLARIYQRLGVRSREEAVIAAKVRGLI